MPEAKKRGRPPIQDADYNAARARKMEADAQLAELELLKAKGELVPSEAVLAAWNDVLANMKAKLLALPTICSPLIATETQIPVIQDIIEKQVHEALDELSAYEPHSHPGKSGSNQASGTKGNDRSGPAPKANRKPVGRPRKAAVVRG